MGRQLNRLNAVKVKALATPGRYADGGGLYAAISKGDRRRWVFLFRRDGKLREMGLGTLSGVSLAKARELAQACRDHLAEGRDPLDARRGAEASARRDVEAQLTAAARQKTFGEVADELLSAKAAGWRNQKHKDQWHMTLEVYAAPLRGKPVAEIGTDDVLAVLQPIWAEKPETAARTRGRIEAVLDAARVRGLIPSHEANPARWRGHLDHLLPPRSKRTRTHHAALPWEAAPIFMRELRRRPGLSARALEFCILTAARLGEVRLARWGEIDMAADVWTCPAERMKAGREHRVPLSPAAMDLLKALPAGKPDALIFPGARRGRPFSDMVMAALYRRMKYPNITTHGFRSTFRDWAGETTKHTREVCEAALAHAVGNAVEQSYRRGDALEKRRALMNDWAAYLEKAVSIDAGAGGEA